MNFQRASKKLKVILHKHSGRGSDGTISVRGQGGRQKRFYRLIDWKRDKRNVWAEVCTLEYDPNRSVNISLVKYADGEYRYILHPLGLSINEKIIDGSVC